MTTTRTSDWAVPELWVDTVGVQPISMDWEIVGGECREGFESYEAPECPSCGGYAVWRDSEFENRKAWRCADEECSDSGEEIEVNSEGPMMNYSYPLPDLRRVGDDPAEAASRIRDLPLCVVVFRDGSYALALTGGGMDLSWEIAEAFTRLGFLPPLHFCDLPKMAGMKIDEKARYVVDACLRSAEVAESRAQRTRELLMSDYLADDAVEPA